MGGSHGPANAQARTQQRNRQGTRLAAWLLRRAGMFTLACTTPMARPCDLWGVVGCLGFYPNMPVAGTDAIAHPNPLPQPPAKVVMGVDELKVIAAELVMHVRKSVTIDWTLRESARARIRVMVRRILRKHGYPPDLQEEATRLVLEQAEALCQDWAA